MPRPKTHATVRSIIPDTLVHVLHCPPSVSSQDQAISLVQHALNVREQYLLAKQEAYRRLRQALHEARLANDRLFNVEIEVGKIYHLVAGAGFVAPPPVTERLRFPVIEDGVLRSIELRNPEATLNIALD